MRQGRPGGRHDIRRATAADIPVIARHRVRMFEDMGSLPPARLRDMFERTVGFLERALPAGEYAGWLAANRDDPRRIAGGAGLQTRTVLPFPFGTGTSASVGSGREALVINVYTEPGRPLYESLGFVTTNEMRLLLLTP